MKWFSAPLLLIPLAIVLTVGCTLDPEETNGYAVIYGVSLYDPLYEEGEWNNLTYTDDDAVAVSALFTEMGYQVITRVNGEATVANLAADIAATAEAIGPDENFVFYFSGHGISSGVGPILGSGVEPELDDGSDEWIFFYGSIDRSGFVDPDAAVSDDQMRFLLSDLPTHRRIVIIDACNSGGFIGDQVEIDSVPQDTDQEPKRGFLDAVARYVSKGDESEIDLSSTDAMVLAAAGENEESYETSIYRHGVFTHHFLNVPTYGDANSDGYITTGECFRYVETMITNLWTAPAFTPRISGGPVDFVLFRSRTD